MIVREFGNIDGENIYLFTINNKNGMSVTLSNYGALIIELNVPDINKNICDVALGYDSLSEYKKNDNFYGAIIGPNSNRIGNAKFKIGDEEYALDVNDGKNNLHSHRELGAHKRIWSYTECDNGIKFFLLIKDGEMGFGGNKEISVLYTLTEENELVITYNANSDKDTPINMTQHCYFNLDGQGNGNILNHKMQIFASAYTPVSEDLIPTGDILRVEGTPLDFRTMQRIGDRIDSDFEQVKIAGGYDHNWCLDNFDGNLRKVCVVKNSDDTRTMEVYTDLPGMQFYAGNVMETEKGKNGAVYDKNGGFALETQYYPDSVNKPHFPSSIYGPKRQYSSKTVYKFL